MFRNRVCLPLASLIAPALLLAPQAFAQTPPDFQRDIRPILSDKCFQCHGPDEKERKGGKTGSGGLRFDTEEGSRADLDGTHAIVPGHPEQSDLIARITSKDSDELMPTPKSGKKLLPREIELLRQWIASGAKYSKHWSYEKPVRPSAPTLQNPKFKTQNSIDAFIFARLEKEKLTPQPETDRYALIRRVSLDLTGLPPTPEEADAFAADKSPDAYGKLVDRLLASSAYGEHWGRAWLDIARYADSAGYADDPPRTIWAYRDWVIRAFNTNMPFDQFTIEQIAGDLLPNATDEQITATAFHRNTMTNSEGGTDDEEFRNAAVVDRANTTMAVWMGTSFACAQCHTHKFDPITNAEYFRLFAFLNNTADSDKKDESPVLSFTTSEQKAQRAQWEAELSATDAKFKSPPAPVIAGAEKWAREFPSKLEWRAPQPAAAKAKSGALIETRPDGTLTVPKNDAKKDTYTVELPVTAAEKISALRIESLPADTLPGKGAGHGEGNFVVTRVRASVVPPAAAKGPVARYVRIELPGKNKTLQLAEVEIFSGGKNVARDGVATQSGTYGDAEAKRAIDGNTAGEYAKGSVAHAAEGDDRWWEVDLKSEQPIDRIAVWNRTELPERLKGFRVVALDAQRKSVWEKAGNDTPMPSTIFSMNGSRDIVLSTAVTDFTQSDFDEQGVLKDTATDAKAKPARNQPAKKQPGWAVGGATTKPHTLTLLAANPVEAPAGSRIVVTIEHDSKFEKMTLGRFRIAATSDPRVAAHVRTPVDDLGILAVAEAQRTPAQRERLTEYYARELAPELKPERDKIAALRKQIDGIAQVTVPVMRELADGQRRKTKVQLRGNFQVLADEVTEGVPVAFHPLPKGAPMNRLTLARWLVDEANPLTARVIANRFWESIFGIGIVRTSEEFGAQGEPPSHPELLDWLATELVREKWDMKKILKLLVTSATYRQSSKVTPELAERDPDNRLLARGPRFRMGAEMVRDQALAVSGLLSRKMFGPSVRPPRPNMGLNAAFGGGLDWATSAGEDMHRRALYTEWRRTAPYPSMVTFDAPNREICTLRRNRTNTPLQALVTMNDPVYIEAAQSLARRMVAAGSTAEEKVRAGIRLTLTRPPTDKEVQRLVALHAAVLPSYRQDEKKALEMATNPIGPVPKGADVADLAAWTTVANTLLNLDETVMKR
ncbi:MAG: DUF1553 domain-containing protein [Chthoniobacteraceae bacterium]